VRNNLTETDITYMGMDILHALGHAYRVLYPGSCRVAEESAVLVTAPNVLSGTLPGYAGRVTRYLLKALLRCTNSVTFGQLVQHLQTRLGHV
jgi:hypothetical protein